MRTGIAVAKAKPADDDKPLYATIRLYESDVANLAALSDMDAVTLAEAFRKRFGKALKDERIERTEKMLRELKSRD